MTPESKISYSMDITIEKEKHMPLFTKSLYWIVCTD